MNKLIYIGITLVWLTGCADEKGNIQSEQSASTISKEENAVFLTPAQIETINIKTGHIEKRDLVNVIKANGYLDVPPRNIAVVSPMISGYVRDINFLVGDIVTKGKVMAELESMEFIDMQQNYIEMNARMMFLNEEYERQKLLWDNKAVSEKTYQKAEIDYKTAVSSFEGLKAKLNMLGANFEKLNQGQIETRFLLRAPISGSVKTLNTMVGKSVNPSDEVFEIVNTEEIHLELKIFEQDVAKVKIGQKVWFKTPSQVNNIYEGVVALVGKDLSEDKRSINVHVHIQRDEAKFTVGMYANATIVVEENPSNTLPVTAFVVDGTTEFIFKRSELSPGQISFTKIPVITGMESDGLKELADIQGLSFEDDIVIEGAFYLLNAFSGE